MLKITNELIPFKGYVAMTIWPFIFIRFGVRVPANTIDHESIHGRQQLEMLIIPFFIWYGIEFLIRTIFGKGNAYRNISFEREAYANEDNPDYLKHRPFWAWFKYLKKRNTESSSIK